MLDNEYRKVFKAIKSCENMEQLKAAANIANLYFKSKGIKDGDPEHISIKTAFDIEKRRQEEFDRRSPGNSIMAADYLFTGGKDVMISTDYLLQALTGAYPAATKALNNIRSKYISQIGNIKDDVGTDVYNSIMGEVRQAIKETYTNPRAEEIFNKILENATGFFIREGNAIAIELEKINEENDKEINDKYDAELAALESRYSKDDTEHVSIKTEFDIAKDKYSVIDEDDDFFASASDFRALAASGPKELRSISFVSEDMEKELEEGAKLMESFYKNKAEDRLKMVRALQKVIDTIKSIDNLEQKETAQNLLNQFEKKYSKLNQIDTLVSSLQSQLDGVLSEEVEEIDEATGGASSGPYVGALGRKPIKRTVYKTDVPVADAGGMTTPIGKLYSFKKKQLKEANVITKQEIIDEALGMEAIPTYDTPGWGNSEFMLTKPKKGKKGKVRVRKGKNYKNTYKFGNNEGSTFVKVKDKCKKFPYCSQGPDAIELTKRIPEGEEKEINEMKLPKMNDIKEGWKKFVEVAKREGKETTMAAKIIKKVMTNEDVSDQELKFVKEQSADLLKIFGVVTMGAISTALPILVEKMLNKKGLSILPKERSSILGDREELVETISKKTGKSKNYVDSLIKRYL